LNSCYYLLLSGICILLTILYLYMILRLKNKTKLHKVFVFNIVFIFLWAFGACNQTYYFLKNGEVSSVWRALYFTGSIFIPVFLLYTVMLYIKPEKKNNGISLYICYPANYAHCYIFFKSRTCFIHKNLFSFFK
jgi:hypothetical protein